MGVIEVFDLFHIGFYWQSFKAIMGQVRLRQSTSLIAFNSLPLPPSKGKETNIMAYKAKINLLLPLPPSGKTK
jgi:hypothetical protein